MMVVHGAAPVPNKLEAPDDLSDREETNSLSSYDANLGQRGRIEVPQSFHE